MRDMEISKKSGMTLVEVMISTTLMAVIFMGAFGALNQGFQVLEKSRDMTLINQLMQSEIESMRSMSWEDIDAMNYLSKVTLTGKFAYLANDYTVYRIVTPRVVNGVARDDQSEVIFYAIWDSGTGTIVEVTTTWFTKDGLNDYYYRTFTQ